MDKQDEYWTTLGEIKGSDEILEPSMWMPFIESDFDVVLELDGRWLWEGR